jgi:Fe-S-cluster containining protein
VLILFPAIALDTYIKLKGNPTFMRISKAIAKKLKKVRSSEKRAQILHKEIEKNIAEPFSHELVQKYSSCRKGCSACCHTQVSINSDEANLLASIVESGHEIDLEKLQKQATAGSDAGSWYKIPFNERSCVFLNKDNACSIYEKRPAVCRTNQVLGNASQCDTRDGIEKPLRLVRTDEADMVIIAGFQVAGESGSLPQLLNQALTERALEKELKRLKNIMNSNKKAISNDHSI